MHLLVIRHAIAEERADFARTGKSDDQRPLTLDGRRRMRKGAQGLREIMPEIGLLASSPYTRAVQTADIVAEAYGRLPRTTIDELIPTSKFPAFLQWLRKQHSASPIAVVGHEPHLSHLVSWFLSGKEDSLLTMKKGGACLIEFDAMVRQGAGVLLWHLTPRQLRMLAP